MPDIIYGQLQLAIEKKDQKAATFLGKMQGWIKDNPAISNTIVNNVVQSSKDGGLKEDLSNFSWIRELHRQGSFAKIPTLEEARQITDGSDPTGTG